MDNLDSFKCYLAGKDRPDTTISLYVSNVRLAMAHFSRPLAEITPIDVRLYRQTMIDAGLAVSTINTRLAALREFFAWATGCGLSSANPASSIAYVKQQTTPAPRWLENTDQWAILRVAERECQLGDLRASGDATHPSHVWPLRDKAIITLMLNTGLRVSEVADLTLDDVELGDRSGQVRVRCGKGGKQRYVPANKNARAALRAWIAVRPSPESHFLFTSQKGGALCSRAVARIVEVMGNKAGVKLSSHSLRHTFGRNMADAGVGLEVVADLMGHDNIETTRRYLLPGDAHRQEAVERISN